MVGPVAEMVPGKPSLQWIEQTLLDRFDYAPDDGRWSASIAAILKEVYATEIKGIRTDFYQDRRGGLRAAQALCKLTDMLIGSAFHFVTVHLHPNANPTDAERLALMATGGYGRGELAPFSDIDIMFLTPLKLRAWQENVIETMLYSLWDMGFKVGHSVRSKDEAIKLSRTDLTIKTALLEARHICGDDSLSVQFQDQYRATFPGTETQFIEDKLAERDSRHSRLGDTRFVVEPNIKDGKGGLRDLQTLWWILQYLYRGATRDTIVKESILTPREYRSFLHAEDFLWTIRVALHFETGRPEDRLTFSDQQRLAAKLNYREGPGNKQVERFMKHYFTVAKQVGDLTRIFLAVLEERQHKQGLIERFMFRKRIRGFLNHGQRLKHADPQEFENNPLRMLEIFEAMAETGFDIHPDSLRSIKSSLRLVTDDLRSNPAANAHFLAVLTHPGGRDDVLRRMNEVGLFGRFVPDFGRVVAQMQFDMYHHFTVDEHTIQAVGLVSKIDAGLLADDHPICTNLMQKLVSKRVLYVAALLHDIAKGRPRDHSIVGAEIAYELCPRFGLTDAETETVAWLVRWHLFMAMTAFKRDLMDPKTIEDFCNHVKSPERLKLLLILTVIDIRAVGPGVFNSWKARLLDDLYSLAEERLIVGHAAVGREARVSAKKQEVSSLVRATDSVSEPALEVMFDRWMDSYWIAEEAHIIERNTALMECVDSSRVTFGIDLVPSQEIGVAELSVYAADHLGLFVRVAGAITASGAVIREAKIHSALDQAVLENFVLLSVGGQPLTSGKKLERLYDALLDAIKGRVPKRDRIMQARPLYNRINAFEVVPAVLIDTKASNQATIIEVNGKDRPGLLFDLAEVLYRLKLNVKSAHIHTYGERAVDVFYVQERSGTKPTHPLRLRNIERRLLHAVKGLGSDAGKAA